jgi:BMFP domain-containing protein YqiC
VPVTAKLSSEFYEKFGDKIANEFVNWFNQVDATYRSEFKDLFEVHFARLEAKLEQRWAQLDARLEQRAAELRAEFAVKIERLGATLERRLGEQTRWLFGAWAIVLASVIGLWFRR